MMEVTVPYLLRCTAALMLLLAGPVFAQTADRYGGGPEPCPEIMPVLTEDS
jgi:hypothetical protein